MEKDTNIAVDRRQSQYDSEFDSLCVVVQKVKEKSQSLSTRLERVLSIDKEVPTDSENSPDEALPPMIDAVRTLRREVSIVLGILNKIEDRLEI